MTTEGDSADLYNKILTWSADRHPRGSQTSNWDRWLPRALEEMGDLGLRADQAAAALEHLHRRGFIETQDGTGSFPGAKVTTITDRGYRFLDRFQGDPVYDSDVIVGALKAVIAALQASAAEHAAHIAALDSAIDELEARPKSINMALVGLTAVATGIQTTAAAIPAWNTFVALASAAGVHFLKAIGGAQ